MSTARDSAELFGPLSELHVHGGGWKLLDASKTSGPRDSRSFCFDASRSAVRNSLRVAPKLNLYSARFASKAPGSCIEEAEY